MSGPAVRSRQPRPRRSSCRSMAYLRLRPSHCAGSCSLQQQEDSKWEQRKVQSRSCQMPKARGYYPSANFRQWQRFPKNIWRNSDGRCCWWHCHRGRLSSRKTIIVVSLLNSTEGEGRCLLVHTLVSIISLLAA